MKIINQSILFLFIALLMSSCFAIHSGNISSDVVESNMSYVETVSGESKSIIVLYIGGSGKNALVQKAKTELEESRFLNPNERYINYTIDRKDAYYFFGLVLIQKLTLHADIVAINQPEDNPMSDEFRKEYFNLKPSKNSKSSDNLFLKVSEGALLPDGQNVTVIEIKENKATVYMITEDGNERRTYDTGQIFSKSIYSYKSKQLGDTIDVSEYVEDETVKGQIVGFQKDRALVKYGVNKYVVITI